MRLETRSAISTSIEVGFVRFVPKEFILLGAVILSLFLESIMIFFTYSDYTRLVIIKKEIPTLNVLPT